MNVELIDITKELGGSPVLNGISLKLESGTVYGLRGKNGSGKTMLMRTIAGLIRPTTGSVLINGEALQAGKFPPNLGVMIENPSFIPQYSGFKNLSYLAQIRGNISENEVRSALSRVGLDPNDQRTFRKYSLGMKQRLGIACAIMEQPNLILLDEPTNALDPSGVNMVREVIKAEKERGALVIVACHDAEELESFADKIYVMAEGRIVEHIDLRTVPNETS